MAMTCDWLKGVIGVPHTADVLSASAGMKLAVLSVYTNRTWEKISQLP